MLKLPNALQEFKPSRRIGREVAMLGMREHVYTANLSTSALLMSYQEAMFGVIWQRIMYHPLRVRMFYG
jgi:hypothetical protein